MVIGCFWMTRVKEGVKGEGKYFSSPNEAIAAYEFGIVDLRAKIKVLATDTPKYKKFNSSIFETTPGRLIFNTALPSDFEFINKDIDKKTLAKIVSEIIERYGIEGSPEILDKIKEFGFYYSTKSGISWGIDDLKVPQEKGEIIKEAEKKQEEIDRLYEKGLITDDERYKKILEIWDYAETEIKKRVPDALDKESSVYMMVSSAARGNWTQVGQMAGLKGLVVNPAGKIIDFPVLASYKEGLSVLQYFITTHGARKGTADTALKTSKAGYLTRRLVDVAQDVVVVEKDCGEKNGILVSKQQAEKYGGSFVEKITGRVLAQNIGGFKKGHLLSAKDAEKIASEGIEELRVFSPITCKSLYGVCQKCYGYDLGSNKLVKIGEAVGIVAAQAIGEPGTQLTMRTFHTGGVAAGGDITMGLPRVEELFELIRPQNPAVLSEFEGTVGEIKKEGDEEVVKVLREGGKSKGKAEAVAYKIPFGRHIIVKEGEKGEKGQPLTDGSIDVKKLFELVGAEKSQEYILNEISKIYLTQGAPIDDKHIEIIIRQMLSRYKVIEPGSTKFNIGSIVARYELEEENRKAREEGREEAKAKPLIMGIKDVALTSPSWLSAASFQNTVKVLVRASLSAAEDKLRGLKENVIIGRLIPAGTGFRERLKKSEEGKKKESRKEEESEK